MADYKEVASNIGRGLLDLGEAVYEMAGNALTGTGNSLYHFSQRKIDARSFFNNNATRWAAIVGMLLLTYSSCTGGCHSKPRYAETHNESAKVQVLEKKVNDLESALKSKRSCAVLPEDHPAYFLGKQ
jgi:hypothetical protein